MESKRASTALRRAQSVLAIALLVTLPAFSHAGITVLIDGAAYPAQLRENTQLLKRLNVARATRARHFEGELIGVGDSWIRASIIRGRWQGIVSLEGSRFVIDSSARARPGDPSGRTRARCAVAEDVDGDTSAARPTTHSAVGAMSLASALSVDPEPANFAVVCQTTVGGACLLAELDIVFDSAISATVSVDLSGSSGGVAEHGRRLLPQRHEDPVRRLVDELSVDGPVQHDARRKRACSPTSRRRRTAARFRSSRIRKRSSTWSPVDASIHRPSDSPIPGRCVRRSATRAPRRSFRTTPR